MLWSAPTDRRNRGSIDEVADGDDVDALFRTSADHRNVDHFDQPRGGSVLDGDNGQPAANAGINA